MSEITYYPDLFAVHEGLPPGVSPADNEAGWQMALVETGWRASEARR